MIHEKDLVEVEEYGRGVVLRTNWSNQAEIEWENGTISMCDVDKLTKIDETKNELVNIYNHIPQLQNTVEAWSDGRWVISKPLVSPELTLKNRIKNAWSVFKGKAFTVKWYE